MIKQEAKEQGEFPMPMKHHEAMIPPFLPLPVAICPSEHSNKP